jgi:hypothetical protein
MRVFLISQEETMTPSKSLGTTSRSGWQSLGVAVVCMGAAVALKTGAEDAARDFPTVPIDSLWSALWLIPAGIGVVAALYGLFKIVMGK